MAEVLASTVNGATSSDIVVAAGTPVTLFLKSGADNSLPLDGSAQIQIKSAGGNYFTVAALDRNNPIKVVDGSGTFRVVKSAGASAFGVDQS